MIDWTVILSQVLQAVLIVVLPPIAVFIVKFFQAKIKVLWEEAKAWSPTITDMLEAAAKFAVIAAEQAGAAGLIEDKKQYALKVATDWLLEHNIEINLVLVSAAIEKAVAEEINKPPAELLTTDCIG
jgi:D-alanyl-D-alanine carboxypeptidase